MTVRVQEAVATCGITPERLRAVLDAFTARKVLVVGDLMLDEYVWGRARRISPEAPVPVLEVERTTHSLGGAANVARNVQVMGGRVIVAGVVGADSAGQLLLDNLQACGCSAKGVIVVNDRPTTTKTRFLAHSQQLVRVDRETHQAVAGDALERMRCFIHETVPAVDAVILSDYAKGALPDLVVTSAVARAKKLHKPLAANIKPPHVEAYRGATLLTLNLAEAERALRQPLPDETSILRGGQVLREQLECGSLLITRGSDGVVLCTSAAVPLVLPTWCVQVFDVSGAGDTVISAAALVLAARGSPAEAAAVGNLAGNIKVTKLGTAAVECEEIRRFATTALSEISSNEVPLSFGMRLRAAA